MRLGAIFLVTVQLCLFICVCNAAPPGEVSNESLQRPPFTTAEDQLIVDELLKIYDGTVSLGTDSLWNKIAVKFNEKWREGTSGFPRERSARSLQYRLNKFLIYNYPETTVKVPEELLQKSNDHRNAGGDIRHPYTKEEHEFIFAELLKPPYTNLFGKSTMEKLAKEHAKKCKAGTPGFRHVRHMPNIRTHLSDMKKKGLIPKDVLDKFPKHGASSSSSSTTSQQTELQATKKASDEDDWVLDVLNEFHKETQGGQSSNSEAPFTQQENRYIFGELLRLPLGLTPAPEPNQTVWSVIANNFNAKHRQGSAGFQHERSAESIQSHYYNVLQGHFPSAIATEIQDFILRRRPVGRTGASSQNQQVQLDAMVEQVMNNNQDVQFRNLQSYDQWISRT